MLTQIRKIKGFGILDNYSPTQPIQAFNILNLVYGWNGSGKTTLGRLFRCLELKANHVEFPNADFTIELADESKIDSKNYSSNINIKVFNQDFVDENLNLFDAETKPIIFLSKEKVEEKIELDKQRVLLVRKREASLSIVDQEKKLAKKIDDFHKDTGKAIKDFLLGTIYANVTYNKVTSTRIWEKLKPLNQDLEGFQLEDSSLLTEKNFTLSNSKKEEIPKSFLPQPIDLQRILELEAAVNVLLSATITSRVIERLKDNPAIANWVSEGLDLHKKLAKDSCEFCGQTLPSNRISDLENHFSEEYSELIVKVSEMIATLEKGIRTELVNSGHLLYDELKNQYGICIDSINEKTRLVNKRIILFIDALKAKKENPFSNPLPVAPNDLVYREYGHEVEKLVAIIDTHNSTSESHSLLAEKAKEKIEYHFIAQAVLREDFVTTEKEHEELLQKSYMLGREIKEIELKVVVLENELKNDTLAIEEINSNLHKFIGRNDIALQRMHEGGYQLRRGGVTARNLSEGEKTAISLIYFLSKLKENDALISDQIIVLDDPISSFDSNHLFNASSLIKQYTTGAKQLFILTHNFWFFKQVRDWMDKSNKKNDIKSNLYFIRKGIMYDAGHTLIKPHSEYQFVFNSVLEYQTTENFSEADCFNLANSIRRMLEAFTSFKTPNESGVNGALQLGLKKGFDAFQKERIYYFLNKYSHLDRIESLDNTVETLFEEGNNVVTDVLTLIKLVDEDHYISMLKVCGKTDLLGNHATA